MVDETRTPRVGQIVVITRGRDTNKYAVIVAVVDQRFVLIADGEKRKFDQPKKKNLIHLQMLDAVSSEVVNSIVESGRVTNGKLRFALSKYAEQQVLTDEKGE
jgi:ribosomal protein L14E/L6E/L27E